MKDLVDKLISWRYAIALVIFILGLSLNLNGSSSNVWSLFGVSDAGDGSRIVSQTEETIDQWLSLPPDEDGTIWGVPRRIRSDEWMVQTPFFLAQVESDQDVANPDYGLSDQNMIVAYHSPVKHISILGKPFNWGALFLSPSRALSWYWMFKIISLLLLSFEFAMIITRKNKLLSVLGSFWISYTPAVQWWFMQHLGDIVWYSLLAMVAIYHFFHSKHRWAKIAFATLLSSSLIGFVLVIYPAFQVVFAYLIVAFFLYYFIQAIKDKRLQRIDWMVMEATALVTAAIIAYSLWDSREAIMATLNTVYPGSRVSSGGEFRLSDLVTFLLNPFLPFKVPTISNQVELASSLNFLPFLVFLLPFSMKKDQIKDNLIGLFCVVYSLVLFAYSVIGVPEVFSKLTLFSFVTGGRSWQAMSVIAVFASLWFISYIWQEGATLNKGFFWGLTMLVTAAWAYLVISDRQYYNYISRSQLLLILGALSAAFSLALLRKKVLFATVLLCGVFFAGFTVNPIVQGVSILEERQLPIAIDRIVDKDPEARWIVDNSMLYNYPQMLGANTLNGVRFYPDKELMAILDPKHVEENDWNRYAHTRILLVKEPTSLSTDISPDVLNINLNSDQLAQLKVTYVLTNRDLRDLFPNQFELLYGPDLDNNMIFRYRK